MIVSNPRRALVGGGVGVDDFPGLPVDTVVWAMDDNGDLALDVQTTRDLTAAEAAQVQAVCQSTNDSERTQRDRARQALETLDSIVGSSGDLTITQLSNAARLFARVLGALVRMALRLRD